MLNPTGFLGSVSKFRFSAAVTGRVILAAISVMLLGGLLFIPASGASRQLAEPPAAVAEEAAPAVETEVFEEPAAAPAADEERDRWPLIGIVIPAVIFLFATWVTASLYSHFTHHGHGGPQAVKAEKGGG